MSNQTRRQFCQLSSLAFIGSNTTNRTIKRVSASINQTDTLIESIAIAYDEHRYRAPYKFGGVPVDRATILNVTATVRTRGGKLVKGFGSMPLGNVWAFPSRVLDYNATLGAMRALA